MKPPPLVHNSASEAETIHLAQDLALRLTAGTGDLAGTVICLYGTLGMGKSVFARALIRALSGDETLDVPSPTFTLVQTYDMPDGMPVYHFDLYRLEQAEDIYELNWEDAASEGLCLIEWPERLGTLLPRERIDIRFESVTGQPEQRHITVLGMERE